MINKKLKIKTMKSYKFTPVRMNIFRMMNDGIGMDLGKGNQTYKLLMGMLVLLLYTHRRSPKN